MSAKLGTTSTLKGSFVQTDPERDTKLRGSLGFNSFKSKNKHEKYIFKKQEFQITLMCMKSLESIIPRHKLKHRVLRTCMDSTPLGL